MRDAMFLVKLVLRLAFLLISTAFQLAAFLAKIPLRALARRAATFEGRVSVIDGDSLTVIHDGKRESIRLFGVDAPERDQPEGPAATRMLRRMIDGETVRIEPVDRDLYGRIVARVFLADGTDVARAMVREGLALADTRYSTDYMRDQHEAQNARAGAWGRRGIIDPAEWRSLRA